MSNLVIHFNSIVQSWQPFIHEYKQWNPEWHLIASAPIKDCDEWAYWAQPPEALEPWETVLCKLGDFIEMYDKVVAKH